MMILQHAPAKLNRFLSVLGRRSDGYHELELVTDVLDDWHSLTDELTVEHAAKLTLEINGPASEGLLSDDSNLAMKAWRLLESEAARPLPAKISLHKRIPHGAGLGGGSSDAAAALRAGNELHGLGLSDSKLLSLAACIGSDVPLFLLGRTVLGLDLGQRVIPMRDMPLQPMLIAYPGMRVATQSVYKALLPEETSGNDPCPSLAPGESPPWQNGLTAAALRVCPELSQVRDALIETGGDPLLCGSGSSWAAKYSSSQGRDAAIKKLEAEHPEWRIFSESKPIAR
jgi:4-diphosphocytidyl-2-C-methyl-D-erythritol kinase